MSSPIGIRYASGIAILSPQGRLAFPSGDALRQAILAQFDQGHHRLLIDLSQVEYLDSMTIGDLVGVYASIKRRSGAMALLNPNKLVREALHITNIDRLLPTFDSEPSATASLNSTLSLSRDTLDTFLND